MLNSSQLTFISLYFYSKDTAGLAVFSKENIWRYAPYFRILSHWIGNLSWTPWW